MFIRIPQYMVKMHATEFKKVFAALLRYKRLYRLRTPKQFQEKKKNYGKIGMIIKNPFTILLKLIFKETQKPQKHYILTAVYQVDVNTR